MPDVAVRSSTKASSASATSISVAKPTGTVTGDAVVVIVGSNNNPALADNNGATAFTEHVDWNDANAISGFAFGVYSRRIQAGDPASFSFNTDPGGARCSAIAVTFSDPNATDIFDVAPTTAAVVSDGAAASSVTTPSVTSTVANCIHCLVATGDQGGAILTPPSGYTEQQQSTDQTCSFATEVIATAGATGTATYSSFSQGIAAASFLIKNNAGGAGHTVAVNQVTETDTAQAITVNPKRRLVNQTTETDLAQAITKRKTLAVGQTTETDAAQAVTARKTLAIAQATETDQAQAITAHKTLLIGQAQETDLAQPVTRSTPGSIIVPVGQAAETDQAQPVAVNPQRRLISQASEINQAQPLTARKLQTLGIAIESDLAQALTARKSVALGQVVEIDLAQGLTHSKVKAVGQALETDQALAVLSTSVVGVRFMRITGVTGRLPTCYSVTGRLPTLDDIRGVL